MLIVICCLRAIPNTRINQVCVCVVGGGVGEGGGNIQFFQSQKTWWWKKKNIFGTYANSADPDQTQFVNRNIYLKWIKNEKLHQSPLKVEINSSNC